MPVWMTAADIAAADLPGLPSGPHGKRKLNEIIALEKWALRRGPDGAPLGRKRAAKGGGWEWHVSLLPERARIELVRRGEIAAPSPIVDNVVTLPGLSEARGEA